MANQTNELIKNKMIELREAMGGRCSNPLCPTPTENLEFAHTKRTGLSGWGRGRKERYYDVLKHPDCYILFCKECHKLFDRGELYFADFNKFICPDWNMFWELVFIRTFFSHIQQYQAKAVEEMMERKKRMCDSKSYPLSEVAVSV